ncbi:MAG: CPBP family intramembrane metalloprotease [Sphingomonadaceae bacterium]|nr:CPBP family intramembrane metalloprotease [Sphingomonadaceae bacterium]
MPDTPRAKILLFLALTFAFSAFFYWRIGAAGSLGADSGLDLLCLMWCPGVAALATRLIAQGNLAGQGWWRGRRGSLAFSYVLPILYAAAVYLLVWASGLGGFDPRGWGGASPAAGLLQLATVGVLLSLVTATGEEIGWRGLLVPELAKLTGFWGVVLISGTIWACWHLPLILFGGYNSGTPLWFAIPCFFVMVVELGAMAAWLRLSSGSLWPAALFHATHNLFVQGVFDAATVDRGTTRWLTGEFGIGLVLTGAVACLWVAGRVRRGRCAGEAGGGETLRGVAT